jgi:hypothetical protein
MFQAVRADAAGMAEPGNTNTFPDGQSFYPDSQGINAAHNLVARDDRHPGIGQITIHNMQIRSANAACADLYANLSRTGLAVVKARPFQGRANAIQYHGMHSGADLLLNGSQKIFDVSGAGRAPLCLG